MPTRARKQLLPPGDVLTIQIEDCPEGRKDPPVREYRFSILRQWRFDFAWPSKHIAVEINGGIFRKGGGAHQGVGALRDMEKSNAAQLEGWKIFTFTPRQCYDGKAFEFIHKHILV